MSTTLCTSIKGDVEFMISHHWLKEGSVQVLISVLNSSEALISKQRQQELKDQNLKTLLSDNHLNLSYDEFFNLKSVPEKQISLSHTENVCVSFMTQKSSTHFYGIDIESSDRKISPRVEQWILRNHALHSDPLIAWIRWEAYFKANAKLKEFNSDEKKIIPQFEEIYFKRFCICLCLLQDID
ncbi:MAG: hypothetical protein QE271_07730 [Bacteriovoracaceae bacterium]|nr:hypothetical protein [Bacteriovoracaceae bacterium]